MRRALGIAAAVFGGALCVYGSAHAATAHQLAWAAFDFLGVAAYTHLLVKCVRVPGPVNLLLGRVFPSPRDKWVRCDGPGHRFRCGSIRVVAYYGEPFGGNATYAVLSRRRVMLSGRAAQRYFEAVEKHYEAARTERELERLP